MLITYGKPIVVKLLNYMKRAFEPARAPFVFPTRPLRTFERNLYRRGEREKQSLSLDLSGEQIYFVGSETAQWAEVKEIIEQLGGHSSNMSPAKFHKELPFQELRRSDTFFVFLDNLPLINTTLLQLIARINSSFPDSSIYILTAAVRYSDTNMSFCGLSDGVIRLPIDRFDLATALG